MRNALAYIIKNAVHLGWFLLYIMLVYKITEHLTK
jgi:hypothetical protein